MKVDKALAALALVLLLCNCNGLNDSLHHTVSNPSVSYSSTSPTAHPLATVATSKGSIDIRSEPPGAQARILSPNLTVETPWEGKISSGIHDLQLSLPGYQSKTVQIDVSLNVTITISVKLQPSFHITYFGPEVTSSERIRSTSWENGQLLYAVGDKSAEEPKDWTWYNYPLPNGQLTHTQPITQPQRQSKITDTTRAELGLCPLNLPATEKAACRSNTLLYEFRDHSRMVYGLAELHYHTDGKALCSCFRLWHANADGTGRVFLGEIPTKQGQKPRLTWSKWGNWILIDSSGEAAMFYLAKTNGSFFERFPPAGETQPYLADILPAFSPNEKYIAFVGTRYGDDEKREQGTWISELSTPKGPASQVSERVGLLQWSDDSRYLYILDVGRTRALYRVEVPAYQHVDPHKENREKCLAWDLPLPDGIRYEAPFDFSDMYLWAFFPDENRLVYRGFYGDNRWGILDFTAPE